MPKSKSGDSDDDIAAMMLSMGDDDSPSSGVPDGSTTIMEMPTGMVAPPAEGKTDEKKPAIPTAAGSSNAASELLRKYMKRPR